MRKQDRLTALIRSFTQGERKFFVQNSRTTNGTKSYLKLYETLLQRDTYDADVLSRKLGKSKADLANEKKYLENALVTSLLNYHAEHDEAGAFMGAATGILLPQKGMNEMFIDRVNDLKKQAAKKQHYGLLAELCYMEFNAWYALDSEMNTVKTQMKNALTESKKALYHANLNLQFEELSVQITFLQQNQQYFTTTEKASRLMVNPLLTTPYREPFFEQARHHNLAILNYVLLNYKAAPKHQERCVAIVERYTSELNIDERGYFKYVSNLVQFYIISTDLKNAEELLRKIETGFYTELPYNTQQLDQLFQSRYYEQRLLLTMVQHRNRKITGQQLSKLLHEFLSKLPRLQALMGPNAYIAVLLLAAKLYLLTGKASAAIDMLNKIIHETDETVRPAMQASARLAFLIAHQELGHRSLVASLIVSTKRFYEKYELYSAVEKDLFSFLTKWVNAPHNARESKEAFLKLKEKFEKINANKKLHPRIAQVDLLDWIDRNIG